MERVLFIINKLQELLKTEANATIMLTNAQLLVAELEQLVQQTQPISVTMPRKPLIISGTLPAITTVVEETPVIVIEPIIESIAQEVTVEPIIETTEASIEEYTLAMSAEEEAEEIKEEFIAPKAQPLEATPNDFLFSNVYIPTLPQLEISQAVEINEVVTKELTEINIAYSEHKVEVAHLLENTHIKDLKKAITINDRYLFINDLFRGDENMFDRSIKTIQGFSILPEATFWIERELKTKLGWTIKSDVVQLFDQLVKRRFT